MFERIEIPANGWILTTALIRNDRTDPRSIHRRIIGFSHDAAWVNIGRAQGPVEPGYDMSGHDITWSIVWHLDDDTHDAVAVRAHKALMRAVEQDG
ncbi:MAG: hypothetical protein Q8M17_10615 [Actinomycetota bacterium]|nr:hypothetical protein [Actinomycetota bacterium]